MQKKRIVITVKDISILTGFSLKKSRQLYNQARIKYRKTKKHQLLTFQEFCRFAAIPVSELRGAPRKPIPKPKGPHFSPPS